MDMSASTPEVQQRAACHLAPGMFYGSGLPPARLVHTMPASASEEDGKEDEAGGSWGGWLPVTRDFIQFWAKQADWNAGGLSLGRKKQKVSHTRTDGIRQLKEEVAAAGIIKPREGEERTIRSGRHETANRRAKNRATSQTPRGRGLRATGRPKAAKQQRKSRLRKGLSLHWSELAALAEEKYDVQKSTVGKVVPLAHDGTGGDIAGALQSMDDRCTPVESHGTRYKMPLKVPALLFSPTRAQRKTRTTRIGKDSGTSDSESEGFGGEHKGIKSELKGKRSSCKKTPLQLGRATKSRAAKRLAQAAIKKRAKLDPESDDGSCSGSEDGSSHDRDDGSCSEDENY